MFKSKRKGTVFVATILSIIILVGLWFLINLLNVTIDGWILTSIISTIFMSLLFIIVIYGILSMKDEERERRTEENPSKW